MTNAQTGVLVSYLTLRRIVGLLGVALPVILAVLGFSLCRCGELESSISSYYDLRARDVLVGTLFTIAWFLFAYRGYERKDDIAGDLACLFALSVALFPSSGTSFDRILHFTSAAALFAVLAYFSLFLFTKSVPSPTREKGLRNRIYVACGVIILVCIALVGIYMWFFADTRVSTLKPVFWLESFALWSFGVSWFVKGDTLFRDAPASPIGGRTAANLSAAGSSGPA